MNKSVVCFLLSTQVLLGCDQAINRVASSNPFSDGKVNEGGDGVIFKDGWVYAKATGQTQSNSEYEGAEQLSRAIKMIAREMCKANSVSDTTSDTVIDKVVHISSLKRKSASEIEVIIKAPSNGAECRAMSVLTESELPSKRGPDGVDSVLAKYTQGQYLPLSRIEPGFIQEKEMTIRVLGGEF